MISGALATVLFPKISSIGGLKANDFTPRITRHTFFILMVFSFLLLISAKTLISFFFGAEFLPAVLPLMVMLPGILAFGVGGVLAADLAGRGKPQYAIYSSFVCLAVSLPLNIILIPRLGIFGAAIASSIAYWADTLVILFAFLKISKKPLTDVLIIKKQDFGDYSRFITTFKNWIKIKTKRFYLWKKS